MVDEDLTPSQLPGARLVDRWAASPWSAAARPRMSRCWPARAACRWSTNLGEAPESGEGRARRRSRPAGRSARRGHTRGLCAPAGRAPAARTPRNRALLARPAVTAVGERVEVMLNVDDPGAVSDELLDAADGVGLFRTEFLFIGRERPARRGRAVRRLHRPARPSARQALHHPHPRRRRRQAPARRQPARGEQPVPGPARPAPVPGPARAVPAPGPRTAARRRRPGRSR